MTKALPTGRIQNTRRNMQLVLHILYAILVFCAWWGAPTACAQGTPQLVSVTPANGDTNVTLNSSLVFVFNQPMDINVPAVPSFPPFLVGNLDVTPANHYPSGTWSADGRTLTCEASSPLPANANVNWTLNPAGSMFPLTSSSGVPLATVSGSFKTGSSGGGGCDQTGLPPGWGNYSISKSGFYEQTSAADPLPAAQSPFLFGAFVRGPSSGPAVTGGSVTLPDNTRDDLQGLGGFFVFSDNPSTEAALDSTYPAGGYTLRFTQTGQPERVIAMTMPAGNPPVPKIANFPAAQAVNASQDFTLSWGAFTGAGANDSISLSISDGAGKTVFLVPDLCVPRTLSVTATSIVLPAGTLISNQTYTATLSFGRTFYFSTNDVPQMAGYGSVMRSTRFTIKTGSVVSPPDPARLTGSRLLPSGDPEIDLTGTPTRSYSLERTGNLTTPNWTPVGSVVMDATGKGIFQDTQPGNTFPLFYRAVAN
jgi:hypothetical protein